jgi:carboxypeptidase C (cathepsin A)
MRVPALLLTALTASTILKAQQPGPTPGGRGQRSEAADTAPGVAPVEKVSTTQHTITVDGRAIAYTSRAGTMVLHDADGKPKATVFYISYTRDQEDPANRPVTFFFNGGPGSASIWLSMGIMSPKHPNMAPNGQEPPPPYDLVDNPNSPLDVTDLVQVDAMMTGYSRPGPGVKATEYTGAVNDIKMFGEFIRDYLDKYNRWQSPKFLYGESYGTFRSAGLASELQQSEGIELNGIMLLGTVLDFQYLSQVGPNDVGYAAFLPTYTATAWYHKKLPSDLQQLPLAQVVQQARDYAFGEYLSTLAKGNTLTDADRTAAGQKLARFTGTSAGFALNNNLRIDAGSFRTELLRDQREMVGRYDSRMIGISGNPANQRRTTTRPTWRPRARSCRRSCDTCIATSTTRATCSTTWAVTRVSGTTPGRRRDSGVVSPVSRTRSAWRWPRIPTCTCWWGRATTTWRRRSPTPSTRSRTWGSIRPTRTG